MQSSTPATKPRLTAWRSAPARDSRSTNGPGYLHVHHEDDEAWHVFSGRLRFRFGGDDVREVGPGTTVYVPAGVPHDYEEVGGVSRYLMILTPRLRQLIDELHQTPFDRHDDVLKRYASEILE